MVVFKVTRACCFFLLKNPSCRFYIKNLHKFRSSASVERLFLSIIKSTDFKALKIVNCSFGKNSKNKNGNNHFLDMPAKTELGSPSKQKRPPEYKKGKETNKYQWRAQSVDIKRQKRLNQTSHYYSRSSKCSHIHVSKVHKVCRPTHINALVKLLNVHSEHAYNQVNPVKVHTRALWW